MGAHHSTVDDADGAVNNDADSAHLESSLILRDAVLDITGAVHPYRATAEGATSNIALFVRGIAAVLDSLLPPNTPYCKAVTHVAVYETMRLLRHHYTPRDVVSWWTTRAEPALRLPTNHRVRTAGSDAGHGHDRSDASSVVTVSYFTDEDNAVWSMVEMGELLRAAGEYTASQIMAEDAADLLFKVGNVQYAVVQLNAAISRAMQAGDDLAAARIFKRLTTPTPPPPAPPAPPAPPPNPAAAASNAHPKLGDGDVPVDEGVATAALHHASLPHAGAIGARPPLASWSTIDQRPTHYFKNLRAQPFHESTDFPTATALEKHYEQIKGEFMRAFMEPAPPSEVEPDIDAVDENDQDRQVQDSALAAPPPLPPTVRKLFRDMHNTDANLVTGLEAGAWQQIKLYESSPDVNGPRRQWRQEGACSLLPTLCKILQHDPAVVGKIPAERVREINANGGWVPSKDVCSRWLDCHPTHANAPPTTPAGVTLPESMLGLNGGHVAHGEVAILRLRAGARLQPHVGFANSRLNIHLGLVVPATGVGIAVGDAAAGNISGGGPDAAGDSNQATWREGKAMVFDDSFEHSVWNDNGAGIDRYIVHLHVWHPALMPLVSMAHVDVDAPPSGENVARVQRNEL